MSVKVHTATSPPDPRRWRMLGLLAVAQFMLILDVTVVAIALPNIGDRPGAGPRHADLGGQRVHADVRRSDAARRPGRRPVRIPPGGAHRAAGVHRGVAGHRSREQPEMLIGGRVAQGIGAAMLSPAALSVVTKTFHGSRAEQGTGHLVLDRWRRCRDRRSARRPAHRRPGLAVGVLHQRADRLLVVSGLLTGCCRPTVRGTPGPARRTGCGARHRRYRNRDLRADQRRRPGLAIGATLGHAGRRGRPVRRVRLCAARGTVAADEPADPDPPPGRRRYLPDPGRHRTDDRGLLPRLVLPPALRGYGALRPDCCSCRSPSRPSSERRWPGRSSARSGPGRSR